MPQRVIRLRAQAPAKPAAGLPCNGCGLCCAVEPCPLGRVLSRRLQGRCRALTWDAGAGRYGCGAIGNPGRWLPWLPAAWAARLARRWVAAGRGCDCDHEAAEA